jgi:hypothetical protein
MIYDMSGIILCGEERCTPPTENVSLPFSDEAGLTDI